MAKITVRFIKEHPAGIPIGKVVTLAENGAQGFISDGYAVDVNAEEPKSEKETKPKKVKK